MTLHNHLARTPPMGWNSYDQFGGQVTEAEVMANAEYMARHLLRYGWRYVVIDIGYHSDKHMNDFGDAELDCYGRLLPNTRRFPSAKDGKGFRPLADYVHGLGLLFGIHVMPGVPRAAVERGLPVLGSDLTADRIALADEFNDLWPDGMHKADLAKPGAQAYYESLFELYASWEVDFVKADGVGAVYDRAAVEALDLARSRCGRPMVLSLSAGCPDYTMWAEHRKLHCEMWRVSEDFWDRWPQLEMMFYNLRAWQDHAGPGHWLDADMLPLGRIGLRQHPDNAPDRMTRFTRDEQRTVMSLWSIAQSPLMFGGDLTRNDEWTLSLLTNEEVLAVNQEGRMARELFRACDMRAVVWTSDLPAGAKALGIFNFSGDEAMRVFVPWSEAHLPHTCSVRDLWEHKELGRFADGFTTTIPPHGSGLYRVSG